MLHFIAVSITSKLSHDSQIMYLVPEASQRRKVPATTYRPIREFGGLRRVKVAEHDRESPAPFSECQHVLRTIIHSSCRVTVAQLCASRFWNQERRLFRFPVHTRIEHPSVVVSWWNSPDVLDQRVPGPCSTLSALTVTKY
jgi:hypothetical protein